MPLQHWRCKDMADKRLEGKVIVISGCNTYINQTIIRKLCEAIIGFYSIDEFHFFC